MINKTKYFYRLLTIILLVELLIMLILHYVALKSTLLEALLDALFLGLISFPFFIKFIIQPFSKEFNIEIEDELKEKTKELKELNLSLEKNVTKKANEIVERNEELHAVWNVEKNIMLFTNGKEIEDVNHSFFEFFSEYKTLGEFKEQHDCICDFFLKREGNSEYIYKDIDNMLWTNYILTNPNKNLKVAMRKDDRLYFFSVHAQKIFKVKEDKVVVTFNDITSLENYQNLLKQEVKLQTDALQKKDKIMLAQSRQAAMGDMISMIAHQWRQPITAISMGAQNMQLDIELKEIDPLRFDKKLTKIVEQTTFLSKTIDDFRNFLKPNKKPEDSMLSEIIEDTLSIIAKSLQNNNIALKKAFKNDIKVKTYSSEVIQVLLNIINNAKDIIISKEIKDGVITINIDNDEKNGYIKICDNAGGIPEDILPRIFEPYFTTKDEKGGTGLGLYMSQMIVEKHLKSTITVENIDGGACFTVAIPLDTNYGDSNEKK